MAAGATNNGTWTIYEVFKEEKPLIFNSPNPLTIVYILLSEPADSCDQCPAPHWPLVLPIPAWVPTFYVSDMKWTSYDFCDANKTTCKWSQAKGVWQSYSFSKQPLTEAGVQFLVQAEPSYLEKLQSLCCSQSQQLPPAFHSFHPTLSTQNTGF